MQYFLFGGCENYPAGGADDFLGTFPTVEAAKAHIAAHPEEWAHIARFRDGRLSIVCAYGTTWETREGVLAWHDCKDAG